MDEQKPVTGSPASPPAPGGAKPAAPKKAEAEGAPKLDAAVPSRALDRLKATLADAIQESSYYCGVPIVRVPKERIVEVCRFLKEDPDCGMRLLADLCGVDMVKLRPSPRLDVAYHLTNPDTGERIWVKTAVDDGEEVPTVCGVWRGANWHEREAFDMLGIRFAGHPDLRRILMPEEFDAFPLRKDFPLEGREQDHGYWRRPEDARRNTYRD